MPTIMDETTRKEMLTLFASVVKEELEKSGVSLDKFMLAVEEKYFPAQRKYNFAGKGVGAKLLVSGEEAVSHIGKLMIAMRKGDDAQLKALSSGTDEEGGYLVPVEIYQELIRSETADNSIRDIVRVLPVNALSGKVPKVLSNATLTNVDEAGNYGETGSTFGQVAYKVHKFGGIIPVTQELLSDSPFDVGQLVLDEFMIAARATENVQAMTGAGDDNNAVGIFKATGTGYTRTAATGTGLTYDDLWKRFVKLKAAYKKNASWLMNTDGMLACGLVKDEQGKPIFVPDPRELGDFLMLGKPVNVFDEIPTATAKTQIGIGDWKRAYFLFDRQQLSMLTTNVGGDSFKRGTTDTRADERVDGKPADTSAAQILFDVVVPA